MVIIRDTLFANVPKKFNPADAQHRLVRDVSSHPRGGPADFRGYSAARRVTDPLQGMRGRSTNALSQILVGFLDELDPACPGIGHIVQQWTDGAGAARRLADDDPGTCHPRRGDSRKGVKKGIVRSHPNADFLEWQITTDVVLAEKVKMIVVETEFGIPGVIVAGQCPKDIPGRRPELVDRWLASLEE